MALRCPLMGAVWRLPGRVHLDRMQRQGEQPPARHAAISKRRQSVLRCIPIWQTAPAAEYGILSAAAQHFRGPERSCLRWAPFPDCPCAHGVDRLGGCRRAKYGPEISLRDLTDRFSYDCLCRAEARSKRGKRACGVYLPDLEEKRPPGLPSWPRPAAGHQERMMETSFGVRRKC